MLILTRRVGEVLCIGDNVRVKVLKVNGAQVSIGVDAPREVAVHRQEIYDRIQAEKAGHLHVFDRADGVRHYCACGASTGEPGAAPAVHLAEDERREPAERPVSSQTGFEG